MTKWLFIILAIGIVLSVSFCAREQRIHRELESYHTDVINTYKDSLNQTHTRIEALVLDRNEIEGAYSEKDSLLNQALKEVRKQDRLIRNYTRLVAELKYKGSVPTLTREVIDTEYVEIPVPVNNTITNDCPEYAYYGENQDAYADWSVVATQDSIDLAFKTYATLTSQITERKGGFFKKRSSVVDITTDNPYIDIVDGEAIIIDRLTNKFGIGVSVGYGFTLNNNAVSPAPYVGIGLNWTPIRF